MIPCPSKVHRRTKAYELAEVLAGRLVKSSTSAKAGELSYRLSRGRAGRLAAARQCRRRSRAAPPRASTMSKSSARGIRRLQVQPPAGAAPVEPNARAGSLVGRVSTRFVGRGVRNSSRTPREKTADNSSRGRRLHWLRARRCRGLRQHLRTSRSFRTYTSAHRVLDVGSDRGRGRQMRVDECILPVARHL